MMLFSVLFFLNVSFRSEMSIKLEYLDTHIEKKKRLTFRKDFLYFFDMKI
jgi:hypothetical protein